MDDEISNAESEKNVLSTMRQLNRDNGSEEFWRKLYSEDALPMVTDLSGAEISQFTQVTWFSETFGQKWLDSLVLINLSYRVSKGRLGRKEAMKAYGGSLETKSRSLFRFRGGTG